MRLPGKQLKRLSVETLSGVVLGHTYDVVIETDGQMIAQYLVRTSFMSKTMYTIHRDQVIRIEEKRMIVEDAVKPLPVESGRRRRKSFNPEPAIMRKME